MKKIILIFLLLIVAEYSCTKDDITDKQIDSAFPANTEWTGTIQPLGRQYNKPTYLRFNQDKTVTMYCLFNFVVGEDVEHRDSLIGNITKIESNGNDIQVSLEFPFIKEEQIVTIHDKKTLTTTSGSGIDASKPNFFMMYLEAFPKEGFSLKSTEWGGEKIVKKDGFENQYVPDLSTINFGAINSTYARDGKTVREGIVNTGEWHTVQYVYQQKGPMVWMAGLEESNIKFIPYFGVLHPSGKAMWVDSRDNQARLPNYMYPNNENYGPIGVTPVIYKK